MASISAASALQAPENKRPSFPLGKPKVSISASSPPVPTLIAAVKSKETGVNTKINLDKWVQEAGITELEHHERQKVQNSIQIIDGKLHVQGDLNLKGCSSLTSLPEGLTVGGNLDLGFCTSLTSLPEGLTVGGDLDLRGCSSLTSLPAGLKVGNLYVPDKLKEYATKFRILKHFDNNSDINAINDAELVSYYHSNNGELDGLMQKRHCVRIAWACIENKELTSEQQQFRANAKEESKNDIRDQLIKIILCSKPDLFKQLPGINNTACVKNEWSDILAFTFNHGFNSTSDVQRARSVNHDSRKNILNQKKAYESASLETIESVIKQFH